MQLEFGGRRYAVAAADVLIGSGPDSTLQLRAPGVLPRHAVVRALGEGMVVLLPAAADAEILVNGARLGRDPTPLMHGDKLRIGGQEITVADPRQASVTRIVAQEHPRASSPPARLLSLRDGREYALGAGGLTIGRDAECGVVVVDDAVSRQHAEISRTPVGDCLTDQSGNGTFVNGKRIREKTLLSGGDVIRVGETELRYYRIERQRPQASPAAPRIPRALAAFLVKSGPLRGQRFAVRTAVANLGRADYNDVRLADPSISASHAKLQLREGVWMLSDLGSTNGSNVDGEPVNGEIPLSPGATITLGDVQLLFEPLDLAIRPGEGTQVLAMVSPSEAPTPQPEVGARIVPPPSTRKPLLFVALLLLGAVLLAGYLVFG